MKQFFAGEIIGTEEYSEQEDTIGDGEILMGIFYMRNNSRRELTLKGETLSEEKTIERNVL